MKVLTWHGKRDVRGAVRHLVRHCCETTAGARTNRNPRAAIEERSKSSTHVRKAG
jgi:hypothetical protein